LLHNFRLVFDIFAALAEFEQELIRERTMARLQAARARSRKGGRKFGWPRRRAAPPRRP
jgi:DNA invertase Pin-like site-specific DNA recombinase